MSNPYGYAHPHNGGPYAQELDDEDFGNFRLDDRNQSMAGDNGSYPDNSGYDPQYAQTTHGPGPEFPPAVYRYESEQDFQGPWNPMSNLGQQFSAPARDGGEEESDDDDDDDDAPPKEKDRRSGKKPEPKADSARKGSKDKDQSKSKPKDKDHSKTKSKSGHHHEDKPHKSTHRSSHRRT